MRVLSSWPSAGLPGEVLVQEAEMIAGAQVGDAWRRRVVAAHALVPDARGGHDQPGKPGAAGADAPVDLLAIDEKRRVEHPDAIDDRHPHEDGAAADPVHLQRQRELAPVGLVLAAVVGPPG